MLATILADLRAARARARRAAQEDASETSSESTASHEDTAPEPLPEDASTYGERQAQDLLGLVMSGAADRRPGRVGIYLHIDLDDLIARAHEADGGEGLANVLGGVRTAHTEADLDISDDTLWGLMAGADVTPIFNRNGRSLSFGRTRRLAPPILRRVIAHRDRRCRFPGCDRPAIGCEAHHLQPWEDDGPTDPDNCAGFCSHHHHGHHDAGFGIAGDAEGVIEFSRPDGSPLATEPLYRTKRTGTASRTRRSA